MSARVDTYGQTQAGESVERIVLEDSIRVELITYGGIVTRLDAPGRGGMANVVLGLPDLATYETRNPNFGATIGRYANRIAGGRFTLDGTEYRLTQNEGDNTLHGGRGFARRVWRIEDAGRAAATLAYTSADGEDGFPGRLTVRVTFGVAESALTLRYEARCDAPTVVNLTNHSYFNLGGEGSGDVLGHRLQLEADEILELDAHSLPTGRRIAVAGTPFDFRGGQTLGARIRDGDAQIVHGLGYDACFVLRGAGLREVARLDEPTSGRSLVVHTDQPAIQLYSGNKLTGALVGPSGRTYRSGDGVCLETQHFPDAPNHPEFPSTVLRPGAVFTSTTRYEFGVR